MPYLKIKRKKIKALLRSINRDSLKKSSLIQNRKKFAKSGFYNIIFEKKDDCPIYWCISQELLNLILRP